MLSCYGFAEAKSMAMPLEKTVAIPPA